MNLNEAWEQTIKEQGADFVYFVDAVRLPDGAGDGYSCAILFGKALSKEYISDLGAGRKPKKQEFSAFERKMDALASKIAEKLENEGYKNAAKLKFGTLPHKTVALRAGLGFIGKNNLLVSEQYGCAMVLGKVLTDAPFETIACEPSIPECGECSVCVDVCPTGALRGKLWTAAVSRDDMMVRKLCTCCLECMVRCPYTAKYAQNEK